jgi:hypothetical protein
MIFSLRNPNQTATRGSDEYFNGSHWEATTSNGDTFTIPNNDIARVGDGWIKTTRGEYLDTDYPFAT